MKTITVHVTQQHLDAAKALTCRWNAMSSCPIALALNEAGFSPARVYLNGWQSPTAQRFHDAVSDFTFDSQAHPLTKVAQRFIKRFDQGLPVKPSTFRLKMEEA